MCVCVCVCGLYRCLHFSLQDKGKAPAFINRRAKKGGKMPHLASSTSPDDCVTFCWLLQKPPWAWWGGKGPRSTLCLAGFDVADLSRDRGIMTPLVWNRDRGAPLHFKSPPPSSFQVHGTWLSSGVLFGASGVHPVSSTCTDMTSSTYTYMISSTCTDVTPGKRCGYELLKGGTLVCAGALSKINKARLHQSVRAHTLYIVFGSWIGPAASLGRTCYLNTHHFLHSFCWVYGSANHVINICTRYSALLGGQTLHSHKSSLENAAQLYTYVSLVCL